MQMNSLAVKRYMQVSLFIMVLLIALLLRTGSAKAQSLHPQQQCSWGINIMYSNARIPGDPTGSTDLYGVAAISASDMYAVGTFNKTYHSPLHGYILNFNGSYWSNTGPKTPAPLYAVAASSAIDVWAVGNAILHYNGKKWHSVQDPSSAVLHAVVALTPKDAWAAGGNVIEHWNGKQWRVVSNPSTNGTLSGLAAISAKDIWAVGTDGSNGTLTEHWNGKQWSIIPSPSTGVLNGATALASNNVWAVGSGPSGQLIEHWDGTSWTISPTQSTYHGLYGVAAHSTSDAWAVGDWDPIVGDNPLGDQWDGTQWTLESLPGQGGTENGMYGIASIPGTSNYAAVGYWVNDLGYDAALIEGYICS